MPGMYKWWSVVVLIGAFNVIAQAQNEPQLNGKATISGTVKDSVTGHTLEYATISLLDESTGKTITGTTTSATGQFSLEKIPAGQYTLIAEFIGYAPVKLPSLSLSANQKLSVKNILLFKHAVELAGVTITARARLIENKIDKLVYNAEKDLTAQGGVATDILKKVPQVSVDVDGNVELSGTSSIRFLINGKPSTAFGASINDVLQSIPASQIKSIEVITNPGAKYDAQGLGGIINIILKENNARGINGNLSLTGGTRTENGSFNFNARKDNFGMHAFISGNTRPSFTTPAQSLRTSVDSATGNKSYLSSNGSSVVKRQGMESGIGFDWTLKKKNSFTGSFNYNLFENSGRGSYDQSFQLVNPADSMLSTSRYTSNTDNHNRFQNTDLSFNYKRKFDKEDRELEFSINSSAENSTGRNNNGQVLYPSDSLYYGIQAVNPGRQHETQLTLDYAEPITEKIIFGAGAKTTFLDIASSSTVDKLDATSGKYQYNSSLSNYLNYHQKVYAGYAEITFPVGHLFDVKAGSRFERTENQSYYSNAQHQAGNNGYNTVVPSVFLSRKFGEEGSQVIKLSYSKRINRPDYGDLNPYINTSDPKNITAGNPYLLPEIGQRYELSYSREFPRLGSFMLSAFYRNNGQDIQPYIKYYPVLQVGDSVYNNVAVSTRENIGTEKNIGINFFTNIHASGKLDLRSNTFVYYRHIINALDAGGNRSSVNYRININASYQFTPLLAAEFFGNFNSARNEVQGKYPSFTTYSMAIRKIFANKKASIALTTNNPFNEYVNQRVELYGPGFTQSSLRKIPFRSFGLNFTWKFGKLAFKKESSENEGGDAPAQQ